MYLRKKRIILVFFKLLPTIYEKDTKTPDYLEYNRLAHSLQIDTHNIKVGMALVPTVSIYSCVV